MKKGRAPRRRFWNRNRESGQGATEYMLVIGVITIALVAGAYTFVPSFKTGVQELAMDVKLMLAEHRVLGIASGTSSVNGNDNASVNQPADPTQGNGNGNGAPGNSSPSNCLVAGNCNSANAGEGQNLGF